MKTAPAVWINPFKGRLKAGFDSNYFSDGLNILH